MDFQPITAVEVDMYSDASGNFDLGFGAYCGSEWTFGQWDKAFMEEVEPSIEYLELYALLVGVLNWARLFHNKRITLFCDNQVVVHMINNNSAKCGHCMKLIRILVLESMVQNVRIYAKYVNTKANGKADALSRLDLERFWKLGSYMNQLPTAIPDDLWPMYKVW